ncbi:cytochrome c3 family protein [Calycomorphotria hydatis]|uniref:nitrite reductase (cytochrome; ammonia-forming) n=1 Tax=Calycomorphotria hydatis TaxID=2528027 RepID=A0A517T9Y6_9PLAN|nr:cytochrome c3 family protein [Calycomorphotria hydatis]QDT65188.1 Doubled CXXCH motif (Paired_CXXCH_1) [Calycomorphotria hydatis]
MSVKYAWIAWGVLTVAASVSLGFVLPAPSGSNTTSEFSSVFLPGETTHGHYQIELKCQACHDRFGGVRDDSCLECHGADLKKAKDTHPKSKFDDPANAMLLTVIDARSCIACHEEHAETRTHSMGVSVPEDFCWQCHQDIAEQRPSHVGMEYNTCASAGCHNFHDNTAIYENFLYKHAAEPEVLESPKVPGRITIQRTEASLSIEDHDGPTDSLEEHVQEWAESQHALAGVNCSDCHQPKAKDGSRPEWRDEVSMETCAKCHKENLEGFHAGMHGMRLAAGLSVMKPGMARLPMKPGSEALMLNCQSCHSAHRANTQIAAADACLKCHNDTHSLAYEDSVHAELWRNEVAGNAELNSGVSCATCHLPRDEDGYVEHNQNANLEPNEKMIRSVCASCHGLEYSINSLADPQLIENCFQGQPAVQIQSVAMAVEWFEAKERERQERLNKRKQNKS